MFANEAVRAKCPQGKFWVSKSICQSTAKDVSKGVEQGTSGGHDGGNAEANSDKPNNAGLGDSVDKAKTGKPDARAHSKECTMELPDAAAIVNDKDDDKWWMKIAKEAHWVGENEGCQSRVQNCPLSSHSRACTAQRQKGYAVYEMSQDSRLHPRSVKS